VEADGLPPTLPPVSTPGSQPPIEPAPEESRPDSPALEPELMFEGGAGRGGAGDGDGGGGGERHDPYGALRSANYRRFAVGFVCSSTGLQMMGTALAWEVYQRTGDALALGLIGLARAVPVILLALPAGHLIDIVRSRQRILVLTQAGFAVMACLFAAASYLHWPVWVLYLFTVMTGCTRTFNGPCRQALLPQIVPEGQFQNAVTWNSGVFQFSATGGPLLAGVMIAWLGGAWPVYLATAAGCAVFAVSATRLSPRPHTPSTGRLTVESMLGGMSHLWHEKTILAAIALDLFAVLFGGATALMPVYVKDVLHLPARYEAVGLGVLKAAPFVGALLMAVVLAYRPPFRRAGWSLLLSVAGFGAATVAFGLSRSFPLSVAMLVLLGALDNISVVIRHVLVQMRTPEHLRGRVSAVNSIFIESSNELGAFESGGVAKVFGGGATGAMISVVSGGIGTLLVVVGVGWLWPQVRALGRLEHPRKGHCPGCDYNLSGLRNAARCPECGAALTGKA
jgi:MFS family permease